MRVRTTNGASVVTSLVLLAIINATPGCEKPPSDSGATAAPPVVTPDRDPLILDLGDGQTLELVWTPAGEFMMGGIEFRNGGFHDGCPKRRVRIEAPYWMGKYEITQAQWRAVMGPDASPFECSFIGDDLPMQNVTWGLCREFCEKLSRRLDRHVRLPSETQWEYACRAGTDTAFNVGESLTAKQASIYPDDCHDRVPRATSPVGGFPPNAFGLCDMHGNVAEFCEYTPHADDISTPPDDPAWGTAPSDLWRVFRGGSSSNRASWCRSALRRRILATHAHYEIGFRVVVAATPDEL